MTFSYEQVGATRGPMPDGFHLVHRRVCIGHGRPAFEAASTSMMRWDMHRRAVLLARPSTPVVEVGSRVGLLFEWLGITCQVVYVVNEVNRVGFAYGTVDGHPEVGEEFFAVEFDERDDAVHAVVKAFSRPGRWYSRIAGPAGRWVQRYVTNRYIGALRAAADAAKTRREE